MHGNIRVCLSLRVLVLFLLVFNSSILALDIMQFGHGRSPILDVVVTPSEGETAAQIEYQELSATGEQLTDVLTFTSKAFPVRDYLLNNRDYQADAPFMHVVLTWSAPSREVSRFSNRLMRRDGGPSKTDAIEAWSMTSTGAVKFSVFDPASKKLFSSESVDAMWMKAWRLAEQWREDNPRRWLTRRYDTGFRPLQGIMQDLRLTLADQTDYPAVQTMVIVLSRFTSKENQLVSLDPEMRRTIDGVLVYDVGRGSDYHRRSALRALEPWGDRAVLIERETLDARETGRRRPSYRMNAFAHDVLVRLAGPRCLATVETRRVDHLTSIPFRIGWVGSTDTRVVTLRRIAPLEAIRDRVEMLSNEIHMQVDRKNFDDALSILAQIVDLDPDRGEQMRNAIKTAWRSTILEVAAEGELKRAQTILQAYWESRLPTDFERVDVDVDVIHSFATGLLRRFENAVEREAEEDMERIRERVEPIPQEVNRIVNALPELVNEDRLHRALAAWIKVKVKQAQNIYNLSVSVEDMSMVASAVDVDGVPKDLQRIWRVSAGHGAAAEIRESRDGIANQPLPDQPEWYLPLYRAMLASRALASAGAYAMRHGVLVEDFSSATAKAFETVDRGQRRLFANATASFFDVPVKIWHKDGDRPSGLPDIDWRFIVKALEDAPEGVLLTPWRRRTGGGQIREMCWVWQAYGSRTLIALGVLGEVTAPERSAYRRAIDAGYNRSDAFRQVEMLSGEVILHTGSASIVEVAQSPGIRGDDARRVQGLWDAIRKALAQSGDNILAAHLHVAETTERGDRTVFDSLSFPDGDQIFATTDERFTLAVAPYTRKLEHAGQMVLEVGLPFRVRVGRFPAAFLRVIIPATDDPEGVGRFGIR